MQEILKGVKDHRSIKDVQMDNLRKACGKIGITLDDLLKMKFTKKKNNKKPRDKSRRLCSISDNGGKGDMK